MPKLDLMPTNPDDFEKFIAWLCQRDGYEVVMPPANTQGYDIELRRNGECIAVQVKNHKAKCNIAQVQKFEHFLAKPLAAAKFTSGWFITANGFGKPALTHVENEAPDNLRLGTCNNGQIVWNYPRTEEESVIEPERKLKYIGVFTCKGGVGKTTVAAHLAGAFALMGHDVILLDLDPDKNLKKLFLEDSKSDDTAGLYVPAKTKNQEGAVITVLNHDEWNESAYKEVKIVICDCSPVMSENPISLIKKFDYCIIPTTLNPLGIAKNADVITRTFKHIREINDHAEMFALINGYDTSSQVAGKNEKLLYALEKSLAPYLAEDPKCKFIHPDAAKIRHSSSLFYWGYHIIAETKPQLAFQEIAGRCYPRTDFLQLAEYLESHTDIDELRAQNL